MPPRPPHRTLRKTMSAAPIEVSPVADKRGLDAFVRVPWTVYRDDPHWVPPLVLERKDALAPKQPVFEHVDWQGFVAHRGGRPVGRLSAQVDRLHLERYGDATGFFGFLDAVEDRAVFAALFEHAEAWLRDRGMTRARGPFSLNINQEVGLLVEGFETPSYFMMPQGRPWYAGAVESLGYEKAADMFAYLISAHFEPPPVMRKLFEHVSRRVEIRPLDRRRADEDLDLLRDVFNDAWADNWGFVPFSREEFRTIGREMLMIIPNDFIQIAEMDGEAVAFIVLLPNLNEAIADLDGRLLPLGWARLLYRLKVRYPRTARIPLMGVRRRLHNTRLGIGLALSVVQALRGPGLREGLVDVEMSWILEDNEAMKNIAETLGGYVTKRYRVYEKALA